MTDIVLDKEFFDLADEFIRLVNKHCETVGNEKAGAALSYASARFSAFLVASNSADIEELKSLRNEAKQHFMPLYEMNLDQNLDDYENNYEIYIQKHRNT